MTHRVSETYRAKARSGTVWILTAPHPCSQIPVALIFYDHDKGKHSSSLDPIQAQVGEGRQLHIGTGYV